MKKLLLIVFGVVLAVGFAAPAAFATSSTNEGQVWVCKYVGKPGVDERLKDGKNPDNVSVNATVGEWFKDGQDNSFVLDVVTAENSTGKGNSYSGNKTCPSGSPVTHVTASVQFVEPTCQNGNSIGILPTAVTGISYATTGTQAPGGTVTVTATAADGYVIDGQSVFIHTFNSAQEDCTTPPPSDCPAGTVKDASSTDKVLVCIKTVTVPGPTITVTVPGQNTTNTVYVDRVVEKVVEKLVPVEKIVEKPVIKVVTKTKTKIVYKVKYKTKTKVVVRKVVVHIKPKPDVPRKAPKTL